MRCLACGAELDKQQAWDHIRSVHLAPLDLTQEKILAEARKIAQPLKIKTANLTCLKLPEKVIYFSLDNAELLIAYAAVNSQLPWTDVVAWQILHEKGHLSVLGRYEPPLGASPAVLVNAEDYYINRFIIPAAYWPVCLANARCAVAIRNLAPVPPRLRDAYFYLTLATFLAYEAVTLAEALFLSQKEAEFVAPLAPLFKKIKAIEDISPVSRQLELAMSPILPPAQSRR